MRETRPKSRAAISEVVASVAMLVITIGVLGGLSALSLGSLRSADSLLVSGSENAANGAGVLLTVVSTQANLTGSYVWVFDYGWNPTRLDGVYLNGGALTTWSSTCSPLLAKQMCWLVLAPDTHGSVSLLFGSNTVSLTL